MKNYLTRPGKNRAVDLAVIVKFFSTLPFNCDERLCLALKWLIPGRRALILPFFVTVSRFVNDLFVFIRFRILAKSGFFVKKIPYYNLYFYFISLWYP